MRSAALLLIVACGRGEPAIQRVAVAAGSPTRHAAGSGSPAAADDVSAIAEPSLPATALAPCPLTVTSLGHGLDVERWPIRATPAAGGPPCIDVVRADASRFTLRVLSTGADEAVAKHAPAWREAFHLTAVTNAGMFHPSGKPVGMIITNGTTRSANNSKMSGYLAWDPVNVGDPAVTLAGRDCPGFDLDDLRRRYHSIVQSYRLLGCDGGALPWKDPKQYSAAAIGLDRRGRIVFLHVRAAVTMTELSTAMAAHDLVGALFLEGGPEASLVAAGADAELARVGSYETGFVENDHNVTFWALPNVLALLPR